MLEHAPRAVVFVLAALVVAALGVASATAQPDQRGWRSITPSAMHWTGLWLGAALTGFMAYIYLFVGSTRPEGPHQMKVLFWLIVAFGLGTVISSISIWLVRRGAVRWRGSTITFADRTGNETQHLMDVVRLGGTPFGRVIVAFRDGTTLRLDPYASGAAELIEKIAGRLNPAEGASSE